MVRKIKCIAVLSQVEGRAGKNGVCGWCRSKTRVHRVRLVRSLSFRGILLLLPEDDADGGGSEVEGVEGVAGLGAVGDDGGMMGLVPLGLVCGGGLWIPAFAGMTGWSTGREKPSRKAMASCSIAGCLWGRASIPSVVSYS